MRKKLARGTTVAWYDAVGNIINLRTVMLDYDAATGRALLNLGNDMRYVLDHAVKYIRPLQEHGSKVCISIEGSGKGLGFCNLTDEQIVDFVAQVKTVVEEFGIDGINLWDRSAGYGKEGMPAVNTTSYPKLIKALREALGSEKLLTVTVYGEPTSTFWDTEATAASPSGTISTMPGRATTARAKPRSCSIRGIPNWRMYPTIRRSRLPTCPGSGTDVSISRYIRPHPWR